MLRKALLLKKPVTRSRNQEQGANLKELKKLWWMDEESSNGAGSTSETELLVGWLEHVCPNLGLYTLRTQEGTVMQEIVSF